MVIIMFFITEKDIQQGVTEWSEHLKPTPEDEHDTLKIGTKRNQDRKQVEATLKEYYKMSQQLIRALRRR